MTCTCPEQRVLPTIHAIGGETIELEFHAFNECNNLPATLSQRTAEFSITEHRKAGDVAAKPFVVKQMDVVDTPHGERNGLHVKIEASETTSCFGKYIYQISTRSSDGDVDIPSQGVIYFKNNINKEF